MAKAFGTVTIEIEMCKGCVICVNVCPTDALAMSTTLNHHGYRFPLLTESLCTGCELCALICPDFCITEVYRNIPGKHHAAAKK